MDFKPWFWNLREPSFEAPIESVYKVCDCSNFKCFGHYRLDRFHSREENRANRYVDILHVRLLAYLQCLGPWNIWLVSDLILRGMQNRVDIEYWYCYGSDVIKYIQWQNLDIRSLPEEPHLAWEGATFSDFRHLSWAYFLCKWAKILICWCLTLLE